MERNDVVMPTVAIVVAVVMWFVTLVLFNNATHVAPVAVDPALQETAAQEWPTLGAQVYEANGCAGCHGAAGEGGVGPAFVGNADLGDGKFVVNILQNGQGLMPAYPELAPNELLAVTNYMRNSWGNTLGVAGPEVFEASGEVDPEVLRVRSRFVPDHITLPEIFLVSFAILLLTYGIIGLYSVWAEGEELRPGVHRVRSTPLAMLGMLAALLSTLVFSALFVRQIFTSLQGWMASEPILPNVTMEGFYAAMILLSLAVVLGLYKKYFMDGEALVEDASGEFPW